MSGYSLVRLDWAGDPRQDGLEFRPAAVAGLSAVEVNVPQQTEGITLAGLRARLADKGLLLNGLAMRYNGDHAFRSGAFTNADPAVRQRAIGARRPAMGLSPSTSPPIPLFPRKTFPRAPTIELCSRLTGAAAIRSQKAWPPVASPSANPVAIRAVVGAMPVPDILESFSHGHCC